MRSNIHTHTTQCDGENTPLEMVQAALTLGFSGLGFSSHAPAPFDATCPGVANEEQYAEEIRALQRAFAGRLDIACGIEQDTCLPVEKELYDYIIASRHYVVPQPGVYIAVDAGRELLAKAAQQYYGGDMVALLRQYYADAVAGVRQYAPTVVGHFDLPVKYNRGNVLFNEESPAYRSMLLEAFDEVLEVVLPYGGMVEVNTGAIARGHRDAPYPAPFLLKHAAQRRARMIITSDAHSARMLDAGYEIATAVLQKAGFGHVVQLQNGVFAEGPLE
ncbi:histidinol-phosphatase HisJ family protein [Ruminococcaceae bacterium OttesenSCG-928-O06]|nr:histidinol-phosphatase HisJ family protein [Ruminococcaceae bacterium OttesenSCG-928-O06]